MVATFQANGSLQMEKNNPESTDPLKEFFWSSAHSWHRYGIGRHGI